ncbi:MAG TPA: redoxin domain-containing protein [Chryseosolibacter sp.]
MNRLVGMLLLCALMLSGCRWEKKEAAKNGEAAETAATAKNDLPFMPIALTDGTVANAKDFKGKNILILFQPDCDHCQHEAEDIEKQLADFKDYKLYFVSAAPMPEIEKFAMTYRLKDKENVVFGNTAAENVLNHFGPIPAPSIYIYNDQTLKKSFEGQTDVNEIVSSL